jgi:ABC-type transporter Mla maintaining outer membrane lipid asymmetry ATPase subunit MlaF
MKKAIPEPSPTAATAVIELHDISLKFGEQEILSGVSLTVAPRERMVIMGQSY